MKNILILITVLISALMHSHAQSSIEQHKLVATTEAEVYNIYEQLLDSAKVYKEEVIGSYFRQLENGDTILFFEQHCYYYRGVEYVCKKNEYRTYISNSLPFIFYKEFLNYLARLGEVNNLFNKYFSCYPLYDIRDILIKNIESGKLKNEDSLFVKNLIEQTTLRIIKDAHSYQFLYGEQKYMTEDIHKALIEVVENPYYPDFYLDLYLRDVIDTMPIDITGIPDSLKVQFEKRGYIIGKGTGDYQTRMVNFSYYQKEGKKKGISPGKAYIEEKKKEFSKQGYLNINIIADYAIKTNDNILLKHLKNFEVKYPDYPLRSLNAEE